MAVDDVEILVKAEHVSKKFCRSLKRSLWYGAQDVAHALIPWSYSAKVNDRNRAGEFTLPCLRKDEFWAVRDVSFEVRRGECLGLIGHNGAGKSTLLKMLNSLIRPDSGCITMRGRVGALIELSAGFNPILTGRENIYNQAALLGFGRKEIDAKFDSIVDFSELEEFLDMPLQNYSSGMRVRLGFAVASKMEPDILIIDEVLAVGDVGFKFKCISAMADLMNKSAVIFVSHAMPQIVRVCNAVMSLDRGRVTYQGVDVSEGINAYYRRFPHQPKVAGGTGDAALELLNLKSPRAVAGGGEILELEHGEQVEIEMQIYINPEIRSAAIGVLFWNMEMLPVLDAIGPNLCGYILNNSSDGRNMVKLKLESLLLNSGTHFISIIVSSRDLSVHYLRQDNAAVLQMTTNTHSGAQSIVQGQWEVLDSMRNRAD